MPQELHPLLIVFLLLAVAGLAAAAAAAWRQRGNRERDARELLLLTLHTLDEGVITTDGFGRVTSMNAAADRLTGWTEAEAIGRPLESVFKVVDGDFRTPLDSPASRVFRTRAIVTLPGDAVLIRKDGSECDVEDTATPIRDDRGRIAGCLLIFRDITNLRQLQKVVEAQLQASKLLASIVESSNDAIIGQTPEGTITSWNAAAETLFGYSAQNAVGRHISLVIPHDLQAEEGEIRQRIVAGERVVQFVTERVRADFERIRVSLTASPIHDDEGRVIGVSKIVRDITPRLDGEGRERELLAESARLAAELEQARLRAHEFIAIITRELRNPLAPIRNAAQVLRVSPYDARATQAAAEAIERQSALMARLIDDVLDVTGIAQGKVALRREPFELREVVGQAVETVRPFYTTMSHDLAVTMPEPLRLNADPARVAQVITNLLTNACKFTHQNGRIDLTVTRQDGFAVINVQDNGIGIAPEELPYLFDLHRRADRRDGVGLGLPLVRALVDLHGGDLTVRSEGVGKGAEVIVRLPFGS